jgi:hypothetical protein
MDCAFSGGSSSGRLHGHALPSAAPPHGCARPHGAARRGDLVVEGQQDVAVELARLGAVERIDGETMRLYSTLTRELPCACVRTAA